MRRKLSIVYQAIRQNSFDLVARILGCGLKVQIYRVQYLFSSLLDFFDAFPPK